VKVRAFRFPHRVKLNGEPVNQMARIGPFSEEVVCPAEQVVRIRDDLPFTHAAIIGCSVATGIGAAIRHARVPAGSSVLVVGSAGSGSMSCKARGSPEGLRSSLAICATKSSTMPGISARRTTAENVVERVREMTEGLGVDAAFDAIGSEQTALQVIDAVAPGGRAVLVGIPAFATRARISPSQMVYGEKIISGTYYGSVRPNIDFPILADLDLEKKINLDDLISRTYRFDEINEGFALMLAGEVARGVIVFD
jgi:S-(hydroxymethyl)glutathione dehydrogenase / alcohol dehydrogenase